MGQLLARLEQAEFLGLTDDESKRQEEVCSDNFNGVNGGGLEYPQKYDQDKGISTKGRLNGGSEGT